MDGPLRICLLGASTDTGNQGVSALCLATLRGVLERAPDAQVTVFDHGFGTGEVDVTLDGKPRRYRRCGLRHSRRHPPGHRRMPPTGFEPVLPP